MDGELKLSAPESEANGSGTNMAYDRPSPDSQLENGVPGSETSVSLTRALNSMPEPEQQADESNQHRALPPAQPPNRTPPDSSRSPSIPHPQRAGRSSADTNAGLVGHAHSSRTHDQARSQLHSNGSMSSQKEALHELSSTSQSTSKHLKGFADRKSDYATEEYHPRNQNGLRIKPVPMETVGQRAKAFGLSARAVLGSSFDPNEPLKSLFDSTETAKDLTTAFKDYSPSELDQVYALSKLLKHHADAAKSCGVKGLSTDASENKELIRTSSFVCIPTSFPSTVVAAEEPLFHSSESRLHGADTVKLRPGRISRRGEDSFDFQSLHTFNGKSIRDAVGPDQVQNFMRLIRKSKQDVDKSPEKELRSKDVLFGMDVGGSEEKTSWLCLESKTYPYHTPMLPMDGEMLPYSQVVLDAAVEASQTVRNESRHEKTMEMLRDKACEMSELERIGVREKLLEQHREHARRNKLREQLLEGERQKAENQRMQKEGIERQYEEMERKKTREESFKRQSEVAERAFQNHLPGDNHPASSSGTPRDAPKAPRAMLSSSQSGSPTAIGGQLSRNSGTTSWQTRSGLDRSSSHQSPTSSAIYHNQPPPSPKDDWSSPSSISELSGNRARGLKAFPRLQDNSIRSTPTGIGSAFDKMGVVSVDGKRKSSREHPKNTKRAREGE